MKRFVLGNTDDPCYRIGEFDTLQDAYNALLELGFQWAGLDCGSVSLAGVNDPYKTIIDRETKRAWTPATSRTEAIPEAHPLLMDTGPEETANSRS